VSTSAAPFAGGTCDSIAAGKKVVVKGRLTGETTATVSQIIIRN
jgi:hypothetical protein